MLAIVPFTPYEWSRIKSIYQSRDEKEMSDAVSTIRMWICRMGEATPVAISCSHLLLHVVQEELKYEKREESEKWSSIDMLKSLHGHAIVRFVNYINEMGQTSSFYVPMVPAVRKFGIPSWIVDVRHSITHKNMPDLDILRNATDFCLDWLWREFWDKDVCSAIQKERSGMKNNAEDYNTDDKRREEDIKYSIWDFKKWRSSHPHDIKNNSEAASKLSKMRDNMTMDPNMFVQTLVTDTRLIMSPSELKIARILTRSDEDYEIEMKVQTFWEPVFDLVFEQKLGTELLVALLWRLKHPELSLTSQNQITAYFRMIIMNLVNANMFSDREWSKILDHTLSVPSFFSQNIIELIMTKIPKMSRKRRNQVRRVLNISTMTKVDSNTTDDSMSVRTVADLKMLLKKDQRETANIPEESASGFRISDSEEWLNVPFGLAPGQRLETFSLIMDEKSEQLGTNKVVIGGFPRKRKFSSTNDLEIIE